MMKSVRVNFLILILALTFSAGSVKASDYKTDLAKIKAIAVMLSATDSLVKEKGLLIKYSYKYIPTEDSYNFAAGSAKIYALQSGKTFLKPKREEYFHRFKKEYMCEELYSSELKSLTFTQLHSDVVRRHSIDNKQNYYVSRSDSKRVDLLNKNITPISKYTDVLFYIPFITSTSPARIYDDARHGSNLSEMLQILIDKGNCSIVRAGDQLIASLWEKEDRYNGKDRRIHNIVLKTKVNNPTEVEEISFFKYSTEIESNRYSIPEKMFVTKYEFRNYKELISGIAIPFSIARSYYGRMKSVVGEDKLSSAQIEDIESNFGSIKKEHKIAESVYELQDFEFVLGDLNKYKFLDNATMILDRTTDEIFEIK